MDDLVTALRALGEPTRLRLAALCADRDLTVSELARIIGQSQPRVSRHLKILVDAGIVARRPEGAWVFHRLAAGDGPAADLAGTIIALMPTRDPQLAADRARLRAVSDLRNQAADVFFEAEAAEWDKIRSLHADDRALGGQLAAIFADGGNQLLDIGTGTGWVLEVLAPLFDSVQGVDLSHGMLNVARTKLDRAGLANATVRQADMYQLPFTDDWAGAVTVHQVLHYADDPASAVREAARVLAPGGTIVLVDLAPHDREELRTRHRHRRLGLATADVHHWFTDAGLHPATTLPLPGDPLTVMIWVGTKSTAPTPSKKN